MVRYLRSRVGRKMKYLKEKLQIQAKQAKYSHQEITDDLIHYNSVVKND